MEVSTSARITLTVRGPRGGPTSRLFRAGDVVTIGRGVRNTVPLFHLPASRPATELALRLLDDEFEFELRGEPGFVRFESPRLDEEQRRAVYGATILLGEYRIELGSGVEAERDEARQRTEREDRSKRHVRTRLLDTLDLRHLRLEREPDRLRLRAEVQRQIDRLAEEERAQLPKDVDLERLKREILAEVLELGPLQQYLDDERVSEVMVVGREAIYVEQAGRLQLTGARFSSDDTVRSAIERIVTPLGRRIDEASPMVDARLPERGYRVNAVIRPLALSGPTITIRKFARKPLTLETLIEKGTLAPRMGQFLTRSIAARRNVLVSGGTGSGKTTLLNILSAAIDPGERIITIEDAAELQLVQPHWVRLETRPPNMEGQGAVTIRDLLRNALRMRPDRIIVGECRGPEALDMLQAMNTGHDGSLTTIHANSPQEAMSRLETLVLQAGQDLPSRAIREQIANSIHLVVQQTRYADGSRKVSSIAEVAGLDDHGAIRVEEIYRFERTAAARGEVAGEFRLTGYVPSYLDELYTLGLIDDGKWL